MDIQQPEALDPDIIALPALSSYLKALEHLAPKAVKIIKGNASDFSVPPTHENPRLTIPFKNREISITIAIEFPAKIAGVPLQPVWRISSICRMLQAMRVTLGENSSGVVYDVWPREVEAVWAAIIGRFTEDISLHLLASELSLTEGYLGERFTQFLGSSFRQLLSEERTAFSSHQLVTTNRRIEDIAKDVALSLSQFNRNFISSIGVAPRAYRNSIAVPKMIFRR